MPIGGGAHHGLADYDPNQSGLIYPDNTHAMVMVRDGKQKEEKWVKCEGVLGAW